MDFLFQSALNKLTGYKQKRFLLAVSGGVDSMVLLHFFKKAGLLFDVAHCNFQLRGKDSDGDELLVKEKCHAFGIGLHIKKFDTLIEQKEEGGSIQMIARKLRYDWFNELAKTYSYDYIVTAHHLNDQIETFFLNISRGTGIGGLKGIALINENLFRPFIQISKNEIVEYAQKNSIDFREDQSNSSNKYKRNLIRNKITPLFEELNESFVSSMAQSIDHLKQANDFIETNMQKDFEALVVSQNNGFIINIDKLLKLEPLSFYLHYFLKPFFFNKEQVLAISESIIDKKINNTFLSQDYELIIDREDLLIQKRKITDQPEIFQIKKTDSFVTYPLSLSFEHISSFNRSLTGQNIAQLDKDKLTFPLTLRKWKAGDTFSPLGMGKKKKKVSDFLNDQKLDSFTKREVFVIESGDEICWVVGYRVSDLFKVKNSTTEILKITLTH